MLLAFLSSKHTQALLDLTLDFRERGELGVTLHTSNGLACRNPQNRRVVGAIIQAHSVSILPPPPLSLFLSLGE